MNNISTCSSHIAPIVNGGQLNPPSLSHTQTHPERDTEREREREREGGREGERERERERATQ